MTVPALAALARVVPATPVATTGSMPRLLSAVLRRLTCVPPATAAEASDTPVATDARSAIAWSPALLDVLQLKPDLANKRHNPLDGRDLSPFLASVTMRELFSSALCRDGPSLVRTFKLSLWWRRAFARCTDSTRISKRSISLAAVHFIFLKRWVLFSSLLVAMLAHDHAGSSYRSVRQWR